MINGSKRLKTGSAAKGVFTLHRSFEDRPVAGGGSGSKEKT